jgi:hypothetical protein
VLVTPRLQSVVFVTPRLQSVVFVTPRLQCGTYSPRSQSVVLVLLGQCGTCNSYASVVLILLGHRVWYL